MSLCFIVYGQMKKNTNYQIDGFLAQRKGITIRRGNAASIMATLLHVQDLGDLYI